MHLMNPWIQLKKSLHLMNKSTGSPYKSLCDKLMNLTAKLQIEVGHREDKKPFIPLSIIE